MRRPLLYSFRRCPYAIRARMALAAAGVEVTLREVRLSDKPAGMLAVSAKGTVPLLVLDDGCVLDESLDIMHWALAGHDPQGWLTAAPAGEQGELIRRNDEDFKPLLDGYKYASRHPQRSRVEWRALGVSSHLADLEARLARGPALCGARMSLADVALFPFVRQFAGVEPDSLDHTSLPQLRRWLDGWLASPLFAAVMDKHAVWRDPAA
ncbi:MAG: glutathione S-transferase [Zoogloeaceae bacterium]|nr:glutathione S-transferase [Rhodocyclaceae bacterium]MCP5237719.1 glutathione S-transferase [Zoogloeaceae bacterium]